ncbi:MAG: hypothetical protein AUH21_03420 [Nitrospirae bacterium 13_2_20CM_62_7]|nr:MAG: hypothetical protein AUH21_03420 [Nitrospirae bacterium 13_2_20CM_62_7]
MPVLVVDGFEGVHIHDDDRERLAGSLEPFPFTGQHLIEEPPIIQAGERVANRLLIQFAILRF